MIHSPTAADEFINRKQLRAIVPATDMTISRWTADPAVAFPKPVKLGLNHWNYWRLSAVREWLRRREALTTEPAEAAVETPASCRRRSIRGRLMAGEAERGQGETA
jgi:predicted DNA-binding transcriptional regulator AlpA